MRGGWVCGKGVALTPLAAATCKPGEPLAQGNPAGGNASTCRPAVGRGMASTHSRPRSPPHRHVAPCYAPRAVLYLLLRFILAPCLRPHAVASSLGDSMAGK